MFCLETEAHAPAFQGRNGNGAMENPGQAGSLGAHAETNRAVCSAQGRGSRAVAPALTSKIYDTVDESVAEPAACWGKARPLQPPAQPYAREYHKLVIPVGFYEVWKRTHARRSEQASHGSRKQEERC